MLVDKPNIVQAEFFHVGFDGSLEETFQECFERNIEGSRSKTAIRFYDEDGTITDFIKEYVRTENQFEEFLAAPRKRTLLERIYEARRFNHVYKRFISLRESQVSTILKSLEKPTNRLRDIAIEEFDFSFRLTQPSELHELFESIRRTKKVWVFLMEPNDLLSDIQSIVMDTI